MIELKKALTVILFCIPFMLMTVWAVVNVAQKDFGTGGKKALWLVVAAVPFIGFIFYLVFGFKKGTKSV